MQRRVHSSAFFVAFTVAAGLFSTGGCPADGSGSLTELFGVLELLGIEPPPEDALNPQALVGGDDRNLVFMRLVQETIDFANPYDATAEVALMDAGGEVRRFEIPEYVAAAKSNGRWFVWKGIASNAINVLNLETGEQTANIAGSISEQVELAEVDDDRLLGLAHSGDSYDPRLLLIDIPSGNVREIVAARERIWLQAAMRGNLVAVVHNAVQSPEFGAVPPGDGPLPVSPPADEASPESAESDASSGESMIELIELDSGQRRVIAAESAYAVGIAANRVIWASSGPASGSETDARTVVRAYDMASGEIEDIGEWVDSFSLGGYTSVTAIGEAGVVVSIGAPDQLTTRSRDELRGFNGETQVIRDFESDLQSPPYYNNPPDIFGQRVIYREPFEGQWFVYDAAEGSRTEIRPF